MEDKILLLPILLTCFFSTGFTTFPEVTEEYEENGENETASSTQKNLHCYELFCTGSTEVEKCFVSLNSKNQSLRPPLLPCSNEEDALNYDEVAKKQSDDASIPNTKPTYFKLGCVNIQISRKGKLETIIKGCYARSYAPFWDKGLNEYVSQSSTTIGPSRCDLPHEPFWKQMRRGTLRQGLGKGVQTTSLEINACFCDYEDGCTGTSDSAKMHPLIGLIAATLLLTSIINVLNN